MKSVKKILCVLLTIIVAAAAVPFHSAAATVKIYGIDVSKWQGNIDWSAVKGAGKNFAIIRAGTSYGMDPYFSANYNGAKANGINVGVYYYTYATTTAKAAAEAEELMGWLKGKQFEYPIYLDMEDKAQLAEGMTTKIRTDICMTFLDKLAANGYYCGIYANKNWFTNYLDKAALEAKYTIWWAQYLNSGTDSTDKSGLCDIWQYSSKGSVAGISGNVDLDVAYVDLSVIIKNGGYNNFGSSGESSVYGWYTTTGNLNMRTGAGTSNSIITTIPKGTAVPLVALNQGGTWGNVKYNGSWGWASLSYLSFTRSFNYTVIFDSNNGSGATSSVSVLPGGTFTAPPQSSASGNTFLGYKVMRGSDSKWLAADGTWVAAEALAGAGPALLTEGSVQVVDSKWYVLTAGDDTFTLYAEWNECSHALTHNIEKTAPGCTTAGTTEVRCSYCDKLLNTVITPKKGHNLGDWTVAKQPTCTETGLSERRCLVCELLISTEVTEAVGHTFSDEFTVDVEPTETEPGSKSRHCTVCGEKTDVTEIPPLVMIGDVTGDGRINSKDLIALRSILSSTYNKEYSLEAADLNGDGRLKVSDVLILRQTIAGM